MTGALAALGIAVVVLASLYAGFTSSGGIDTSAAGPETTPASGADREASATVTPSPTRIVEAPTPTPELVTNRENCREIRGTDYLAPEERTWFLANCVTR